MIEYRKAQPDDISALTKLRMDILGTEPGMTDELTDTIRRNTEQYTRDGFENDTFLMWIAEQDGAVIGMGGVCFFPLPPNDWCPAGKTAYIGNLYTLPSFRRRGIAKKLLSLLTDEAVRNGCERILLNTTEMGKTLYEKAGFEPWPSAMAYYPRR